MAVLLSSAPAAPAADRWRPKVGVSWQLQLQGRVDLRVRAHVFEIDSFETRRAVVRRLHGKGRRAVCYMSAGSWERWRPDADRFPAAVLGRKLDGWPGERWLDVRRRDVLRPLMARRLNRCERKGFDGVEFDNVDGYQNESGFPLTGRHQARYNRMLARLAHARGLAAGLKNDLGQVRSLEPYFDFAVNEQCFEFHECGRLRPFLEAGKPVFHVEYTLKRRTFCSRANELGLSSMRKRLSLRRWRRAC